MRWRFARTGSVTPEAIDWVQAMRFERRPPGPRNPRRDVLMIKTLLTVMPIVALLLTAYGLAVGETSRAVAGSTVMVCRE